MCTRKKCAECGKPTYAGCGMHVEQVLGDVPPDQRCRCREERGASESSKLSSWLSKLVGG